MNADPIPLTVLLSNSSQRFVIPVYQRPYSWGEEQCIQLWDDILDIANHPNDKHFTGSVVWVQDGTMSASGATPLLLIDGQQRITTAVLLLIALAEYAHTHKDESLLFSYEGIVNGGSVVMTYREGVDRYKLTLSQGDKATLESIVDHLVDSDCKVDKTSSRLIENLDLFRGRLEAIDDVNRVWNGLQRLEVVSISLTQGHDNPQLIFESMNSTGKDLSSADLIRNFVLMGLPMDEQEKMYKNHWRVIEETLGQDVYDSVFDDFIRNYLTVINAPEPLVKRDVYSVFKRHVRDNGYNKDGRMVELLKELERFARYYACITAGAEKDSDIKRVLANIAKLDTSTLNPLLLSFYDDYESGAFDRGDFLSLLETAESYVFRRAACDCASNTFNNFFPSIIARLNKVQDEGGNYLEAFEAMLLNEAGTNRRFPTDTEFERELIARDSYHFKKSLYLLSKLENAHHPKDERDFYNGTYTIEHIMPQNALAHKEWREMLGDDYEEKFENGVNNLGNLTLTAYNSELSDGTFEQKKERAVGGYNNEYIAISSDLKNTDGWGETQISARAKKLKDEALKVWPIPELADDVREKYIPEKKTIKGRVTRLRELVSSGMLPAGSVIKSGSSSYQGTAVITPAGTIRLNNGEEFGSPSAAASRFVQLAGGSGSRNGWYFWENSDGKRFSDLRSELLAGKDGSVTSDNKKFRNMFWDGFYEYCSADPAFVGAFGDPSGRMQNSDAWASFGIGIGGYHPDANLYAREGCIGVDIWFITADYYLSLLDYKDEVDAILEAPDCEIHWDDTDEPKKSRSIVVKKKVDFDSDDWDEMYSWLTEYLCKLKAICVKYLISSIANSGPAALPLFNL